MEITDKTVTVSGNLKVEASGNLRLVRSTLIMLDVTKRISSIDVLSGGSLVIEDSVVTASSPTLGYKFIYYHGSKGMILRSTIEYVSHNDLNFGSARIREHASTGGLTISSDGFILRDSVVRNGAGRSRGILVAEAENVVIERNVITGHPRDGLRLAASKNVAILKNRISGNSAGIKVMESSHSTIADNVISGNHLSEAFPEQDGISLYYGTTNLVVEGNQVIDNRTNGIVISGSSGNVLVKNIVTGNGARGIWVKADSMANRISDNTLSNNRLEGIYIEHGSKNNVACDNAILFLPFNGVIDDYENIVKEDYRVETYKRTTGEGLSATVSFEKGTSQDGSTALQVTYAYTGTGFMFKVLSDIGQDWTGFTDVRFWVLPNHDVRVRLELAEQDGDLWIYTWSGLKIGEWNNIRAPLASFLWRDDISTGDGVLHLNGIAGYHLSVNPTAPPTKNQQVILFDDVRLFK
jgi:parallel beta-helix repeat protein